MSTTTEQFRSDLDELREELPLAAQMIERAGRNLAADGLVPDHDLITTLATIRRRFSTLQARLLRSVEDEGLQTELTDANTSLEVLQDTFAQLEEHRYQRKQNELVCDEARQILVAARQLVCEGSSTLPTEITEAAGEMESELRATDYASVPAEVRELVEGPHPLVALLKLSAWGDQLDDEEWTQCHELVLDGLGRSVATAVARGRIRCPEDVLDRLILLGPTAASAMK